MQSFHASFLLDPTFLNAQNDRDGSPQDNLFGSLRNHLSFGLRDLARNVFLLHVLFLGMLVAEVVYFVLHVSFFVHSFTVAISLALFVITLFFYATMCLWMQTWKQHHLFSLRDTFLKMCEAHLRADATEDTRALIIATMFGRLTEHLRNLPFAAKGRSARWDSIVKGGMHLLLKQDLFKLRELLLEACILEHLKWVREAPTNLDAHAALANGYILLSGLYAEYSPKRRFFMSSTEGEIEALNRFQEAAYLAIEEFKILKHYAPHDPWIHTQLAYSYRDLKMPQEEIREYEILRNLCPEDADILRQLGQLYFLQGENAKGLEVYEALKEYNPELAAQLLSYYGSYARIVAV